MPFGNLRDESQRDSDPKPLGKGGRRQTTPTPLGLKPTRPGTQGSWAEDTIPLGLPNRRRFSRSARLVLRAEFRKALDRGRVDACPTYLRQKVAPACPRNSDTGRRRKRFPTCRPAIGAADTASRR